MFDVVFLEMLIFVYHGILSTTYYVSPYKVVGCVCLFNVLLLKSPLDFNVSHEMQPNR